MTLRGVVTSAILIAVIFMHGGAIRTAGAASNLTDYFRAAAASAGTGARTADIRQRRVAAALSPLVTQAIVRQPGQISGIIQALRSAAPQATPMVAQQAMAAFPGYAGQIAQAAGLHTAASAPRPSFVQQAAPVAMPAAAVNQRRDSRSARAAAWAISAIAANPGAIGQIMSRAVAAAPGQEGAVIAAVQAAYPGFAGRIGGPGRQTASASFRQTPALQPIRPAAARPMQVQTRQAAPAPSSSMMQEEDDDAEIDDPIEGFNRVIFAFNDTVDLIILRPIAKGYNWIMPDPAIHAVRRFFLNLDAPVIFANDLLQGDLGDASVTLGRFGINTTIGILGLFDPAEGFGLARHHADFGQTLHNYGVGAGPYLVLPLLGPASTRGGVGKAVDVAFQPLTYFLSTLENLGVAAARGVVRREQLLEPLDDLRENSVDYYTSVKAAFWQTRQVELNKGIDDGLGADNVDKLFDAAN